MGHIESEKGFTLLELLIALTIFAVGLLALAGMQVTAIQTNASANTLTAATALAEGVLEEFLSLPANHPLLNTEQADFTDYWAPATRTIGDAGTYEAEYQVAVNTPVNDVTTITVRVFNDNRTVTMTGFKCIR